MKERRYKDKRKILIEPQVQMKLIGSFLTIFLISNLSLLGLAVYVFNKIHDYGLQQKNVQLITFLDNIESSIFIIYLEITITSAMIIFYYGLKVTQRIVGPIKAVKLYLKKICNDEDVEPLSLRKNDYFLDLKNSLNEALTHLKNK
jgi:hypothetical protein